MFTLIEAWFDGAVEPVNPGGHGGYGMLVKRDGQTIHGEAIYMGRWPTLSNNCAEYAGCISVLRYFIKHNVKRAVVYGDADMIVKQVNGEWRIRGGAYIPYFHEAYALKQQLPEVVIVWIPREQNVEADNLSKQAVLTRPRAVEFQLDPNIKPIVKEYPRNPSRKRRKRERARVWRRLDIHEDEALEVFQQRYGDL